MWDTRPWARALQPGLGVSKELQAVGDIAITVVGGVGRDPVVLPKRTLSMVMKMADCFAKLIFLSNDYGKSPDIPMDGAIRLL